MEILWDYRVVLDLFLGGVGIGAFLFGAILFYINASQYESIIKKSWLISPVLIILGLLILITELGRPFNIVKALISTNPTSFMSIGIYLQGICLILMLLILIKLKNISEISKSLVYLAAAFAGLVGLYHGFLLTGMGNIVWNSSVPLIFFLSSIIAGTSLSLVISSTSDGYKKAIESLKLPLIFNAMLTLQLVAIFSWIYALTSRNTQANAAYAVLMSSYSMELWILVILIGIIVPLAMFTLTMMKKVEVKSIFLPTALCILVGSFFLKHLVVYFGQMV